MPKEKYPADKLIPYDALIDAVPGVERKGATMPYTSLNGNMFSFLDKDGNLALRLSQKDREEFMAKYKTTLVEAHGTVMKEYVFVPEELLKRTDVMQPYLKLSYEYAATLKPKPTKK